MKIVILGTGHMGSWLAKELSRENEVAVYDIDEGKSAGLDYVFRLRYPRDIKDYRPELLINAVSLRHTIASFEETCRYLPGDCMISDVASIKGEIADFYSRAGFKFVSVHPMFGPTFANMDSLREENAVIINESSGEGKQFFVRLFTGLGVSLFEYSFDEHDRMMAYSLTVPFVSSMMFAGCVDAKTVPGTTFKRQMAIARHLLSEDDHLLAETLFNPHSVAQLGRMTSQLQFLKHIIAGKDYEVAREFFAKLRENIGEPADLPES
jgi:prephenate dehydrogenase